MAWEADWEASYTRLLGATEQMAQTFAHAAETVPALAGVRSVIARIRDELARARDHITPPAGREPPLAPAPATALGVDLPPLPPDSATALDVPLPPPPPKSAPQPVPIPPVA